MNTLRPPVDPRPLEPVPTDLDRLLRAFFRAEMPEPWPILKPPARPILPSLPSRRGSRWTFARSRLALAASVLLLLCGPLWLSNKFSATIPPVVEPGAASSAADRGVGHLKPAKELCPGASTNNRGKAHHLFGDDKPMPKRR
jgi:hypothetical protein